jgi:hypothetical protein
LELRRKDCQRSISYPNPIKVSRPALAWSDWLRSKSGEAMTSTPQEYWDACLIKTWREYKQLFDTVTMFKSITGKEFSEYDPPLNRVPHLGMPWKMTVRHFVAQHLPKISERLWEQPPEQDVALLRKLSASNYTTIRNSMPDNSEILAVRHAYKQDVKKLVLDSYMRSERNSATNGNVVKGAAKVRVRRK